MILYASMHTAPPLVYRTPIGTFTPALYDEAKSKGWNVISMKNDWKRIFTFDK